MNKIIFIGLFVTSAYVAFMFSINRKEEKNSLEDFNRKYQEKEKSFKSMSQKKKEITVVTSEWDRNALVLFESKQDFNDYKFMQKAFKEDAMDAYDNFMDKAEKSEKGFRITELEEGEYKKIEDQYMKAFQKRFGQKTFLKFIKALDDYNDTNPNEQLSF